LSDVAAAIAPIKIASTVPEESPHRQGGQWGTITKETGQGFAISGAKLAIDIKLAIEGCATLIIEAFR
jgi:hypothetical protein